MDEVLEGTEEGDVILQLGDDGGAAEARGVDEDEAGDLGRREAEVPELHETRGQSPLDLGAEKLGVVGDGSGDVGVGETEVREEGEHGVGSGGGLEVREHLGGLERLRRGEVACGDEVVLDGEGGSAASRFGGGGGESSRGETALVAQGEESDGRAGTDGEREVLFLDKEHGHGCRRRRG